MSKAANNKNSATGNTLSGNEHRHRVDPLGELKIQEAKGMKYIHVYISVNIYPYIFCK